MNHNELQVGLADFKLAMKRFRQFREGPYRARRYRKAKQCPQALIAFNDGMLSFEAGGDVAVIHAEGEWHGHAFISAAYLGALCEAPPNTDPVILRYENGKLQIATLTLGCEMRPLSEAGAALEMVKKVEPLTQADKF